MMDFKSECAKKFYELREYLNKNGKSSYKDFDELNDKGFFVPLFNQFDLVYLFKMELHKFFNMIDSPYYQCRPALRTLDLHRSGLVETINTFDYMISLYLNNTDCYTVFPLLMYEACRKFNVSKYKDLTLEELNIVLEKNVFLEHKDNKKWKRESIEVMTTVPKVKYDEYKKYKESHNNKLDIRTMYNDSRFDFKKFLERLSIYAEELAHKEEENRIGNIGGSIITPVASTIGDGYGYDEYSYNIFENRERLIEVKATTVDKINLSKNEYRRARQTQEESHTDYYIHKYYYNIEKDTLTKSVLKYDKEKDIFIDIETNEIYLISPHIYYDPENNYKETIEFCIEKEKVKELEKKI